MARGPARLQFRVQLRFVTEEQLFGAGPLSPPSPKCLRLDVHPAGEEADATVTDGEVPSPAGKSGRSARGSPVCVQVRGAPPGSPPQVCAPRLAVRGDAGCLPRPDGPTLRLSCAQRTWKPRGAGP